jgi:hypothetical protein
MRTITETINVFPFDELSDEAKEKAREKFREWEGETFSDMVDYEDFISIGKMLGIEINAKDIAWRGFWSQGDGASFTGSFAYAKGMRKAIRAYAPSDSELHELADNLADLQRRNFYRLNGRIDRMSSHYVHENTMTVDAYNGERYADSDTESETKDIMRRLAQWFYRSLESEYEWRLADEQIDETIRANEYEFTEDGRIY